MNAVHPFALVSALLFHIPGGPERRRQARVGSATKTEGVGIFLRTWASVAPCSNPVGPVKPSQIPPHPQGFAPLKSPKEACMLIPSASLQNRGYTEAFSTYHLFVASGETNP